MLYLDNKCLDCSYKIKNNMCVYFCHFHIDDVIILHDDIIKIKKVICLMVLSLISFPWNVAFNYRSIVMHTIFL